MAFDATARAARDAAFAAFGRPVSVDPDGAAALATALVSSRSVTEQFGPIEIVQHGRYLRFKAEDNPADGALLALLSEDGLSEIERRRVQGAAVYADGRRLVVERDTRPA